MIYIKEIKVFQVMPIVGLLLMSIGLFAQESLLKRDALTFPKSVRMTGEIGIRLDASYKNRILAQDVEKLLQPFSDRTETRCWQSEFWGKWFTSAVLAYRYRPEPKLKAVLDKAVSGLLATQTSDGYIGNYALDKRLEQWDIWGRKYCMLGLLDYYDLTGDKKSLQAARRVADNLLDDLAKGDGIIVTKGNYRGLAASSVLEPICLLYVRTKAKKYLDFAEEIVRQWETPEGPQLISKTGLAVAHRFPKPMANVWTKTQAHKAYEMMSCYEGLLELYRITGKTAYKEATEKTWQNILDTEINVAGSGASGEIWFGGKAFQTGHIYHYQETCVTVTWIKLSHQLLRLTTDPKYADAVEQSYYNALLGAMSTDGKQWAKYMPLMGQRLPGSEQCGMGLNCCEASGPRGLFNLPQHTAMQSADGLLVNYFVEGEYSLITPKKQIVVLEQQTNYPVSGKISMRIKLLKEEELTISVRIPHWSKESSVKVNGRTIGLASSGTYHPIKRRWRNGDHIEIQLDMRGRVSFVGKLPQYASISRGPILLTRDARLSGLPIGTAIVPLLDKNGNIELEAVTKTPLNVWMQFSASFTPEFYKEGPPKPIKVNLCDYASAGNDDLASVYEVWMPQVVSPLKIN